MKWTKEELLQSEQKITFDEMMDIDRSAFAGNSRINGVKDVHVHGSGWYSDQDDRFYVELKVEGVMLLPDSISNEEIEVPFETESSEVYVFTDPQDDSERVVDDDVVDLERAVRDDILLEVPLEASIVPEEEYPEGDGWKVYSEAEYQESRKDRIDPRLAKLKQFKNE